MMMVNMLNNAGLANPLQMLNRRKKRGETESSEVWVKAQEALRRWARLIYWLQIIFHPHPNAPNSYHHRRHNRPQFLIGGGVLPLNIIGDQRPNLIHSTPPSLVVVLKGNMNKRSGPRLRSFTFS